jgi:hypothetical protein
VTRLLLPIGPVPGRDDAEVTLTRLLLPVGPVRSGRHDAEVTP